MLTRATGTCRSVAPAHPLRAARARQVDTHVRAGTVRGHQVKRGSNDHRPFAHRLQPEVAGTRRRGFKTTTVIADLQDDLASANLERDVDTIGAGMPDDVAQRLSAD